MEIKKLDSPVSISDSALVRLKEMGNITEIMYSEKRSRGGYITKVALRKESVDRNWLWNVSLSDCSGWFCSCGYPL